MLFQDLGEGDSFNNTSLGLFHSSSILLCWAMALIPTVPLWFDQTTADAWQDKTDCKCFYPLTNVSVTSKYIISNANITSKYQEYFFSTGFLHVVVLCHHVHHPNLANHPHLGGNGPSLCHRIFNQVEKQHLPWI